MAATLACLQIPTVSSKSSSQSQLLVPSDSAKLNVSISLDQAIRGLKSASLPLTAITLPFILNSQDALAAGGEFGILEGRSLALVHPIVMAGLFAYTLYAGYLGWQWRRVRTIQNEINELKKQEKPAAVTPEGTPVPAPPSPLQTKIQQLSEERKELIKGQYKDKHFNAGSILLAFGVIESVGGGVNTYLRTGKLFPGPHLYAGAAITVLWAAAAALVPPMQKGNETARNLHIALNVLNVLLFIWQIPTGWDIVLKRIELLTPWTLLFITALTSGDIEFLFLFFAFELPSELLPDFSPSLEAIGVSFLFWRVCGLLPKLRVGFPKGLKSIMAPLFSPAIVIILVPRSSESECFLEDLSCGEGRANGDDGDGDVDGDGSGGVALATSGCGRVGDDVGGAPLEGGGCGGGGGAGADGGGGGGGRMVNERNQGRDGAPCWVAIVFVWKIDKMISNARCTKSD
nr:hypothetical protein CTI12_AA439240 [Tanacetum cinerariifolium]